MYKYFKRALPLLNFKIKCNANIVNRNIIGSKAGYKKKLFSTLPCNKAIKLR